MFWGVLLGAYTVVGMKEFGLAIFPGSGTPRQVFPLRGGLTCCSTHASRPLPVRLPRQGNIICPRPRRDTLPRSELCHVSHVHQKNLSSLRRPKCHHDVESVQVRGTTCQPAMERERRKDPSWRARTWESGTQPWSLGKSLMPTTVYAPVTLPKTQLTIEL